MPRLQPKRICMALAAVTLALTGCGKDLPGGVGGAGADTVQLVRRGPGGVTRFLARNLNYRVDANIGLAIQEVNADVVLKDPTMPFVPANKGDFSLTLHHAVVTEGAADLEALMNNYVFVDRDSPLKDIKMRFEGNQLVMSGKMKKGVWVGFEMFGEFEPTANGKIRMIPKKMKSLGLRVDGLLNLFGVEMSLLLKMKEEKGLSIQGNDIIMDVSRLFPPPTMNGKVVAVAVRNDRLHIEFDDGKAQPWPADLPYPQAKATLVMWGGDVLINAALSLNAKLQIMDGSPNTPMTFAIDRYREQLQAGFVVPTKTGMMIAYVPDIINYNGEFPTYQPPSFPVPGMDSQASEEQDAKAQTRR